MNLRRAAVTLLQAGKLAGAEALLVHLAATGDALAEAALALLQLGLPTDALDALR